MIQKRGIDRPQKVLVINPHGHNKDTWVNWPLEPVEVHPRRRVRRGGEQIGVVDHWYVCTGDDLPGEPSTMKGIHRHHSGLDINALDIDVPLW